MANFRPLQPAPMEEQVPQPHGKPFLTQKPKRTVTLGACVACRKRKSKCDGTRPICSCCSQKDTRCVYDLGPNEKPSQAMKRKNEEMQDELSSLRQLYDSLRMRPEHEALAILHKIRAESPGSSPAHHIRNVTESLRRGQSAYNTSSMQLPESANSFTLPSIRVALDSLSPEPARLPFTSMFSPGYDEPSSQRRRHTSDADVSTRSDSTVSLPPLTSIEALLHPENDDSSDPRLGAIANWTSVSKDTQVLAMFMTLWHKWEYSYYHYLDWDIFLDDLSSGNTDFCSELLVNALLATASFHSSLVKNRSKPFGDSIITRFYREARRLWEAEETQGEKSLPRIQAAMAFFMVFGKHGRDKVGYVFLQEACRLAHNLGLFCLPSPSFQRPHHVPQHKWERARAVTAWALFNFQLTMSFLFYMPPLINSPPLVAIPYEGVRDTEDLFRDECARSVVLLELLNSLIDAENSTSDIPPKPEEVEILYLRLKLWFDRRRSSLYPAKHASPQNLLAAMQYHVFVLRLFQPFTNYESPNEQIKSYRDQALLRTSAAMTELRRLIFLYDNRHGWADTVPIVMHPLMVASFASLEELAHEKHPVFLSESNEIYQGLLTCLHALSTIATYNFYAQLLFRHLAQSCLSLNIPVPVELVSVLDRLQSEEWTKTAASMVSSHYVPNIRKTATEMENARMDAIISQWDALIIKDDNAKRVLP
ncbi:hypothetical protein BU23DRAFT_651917 [Bimuria novae-zelandiae CBS 107.79]|uniref:Zn(2)-C6 fungal-type domain-containing protein n=1 Tax=Bimuria novae-zelandiae CBS 107.79 TaxID=1447943 RepID=A0A6A5UXK8_9PLEO|nr:hypothetical protein BU23DRAFT_651917 [Bimuria novae-zelandiae CBS 107.79]